MTTEPYPPSTSLDQAALAASGQAVSQFWEAGACAEASAVGETPEKRFAAARALREKIHPYLSAFADFPSATGKDVLEIGLGLGSDHVQWATHRPRSLTGIDVTERALNATREHLDTLGLKSTLELCDAQTMPFAPDSFDIVYSWGVIMHAPDTERIVREIHRVLRPGGLAKVMIYHRHSITGALLWLRHGLLAGRPRRTVLDVYMNHLESPGTKAYTIEEAGQMFRQFSTFSAEIELGGADLMLGIAGQTYSRSLMGAVRALWPRFFVKRYLRDFGHVMMITAVK